MVHGNKTHLSFIIMLIESVPNIHFHNLLFRLLIFLIVINSKSNKSQMEQNEVDQIVVRCQEGSKKAFRWLVREYQSMVFSLTLKMLCDERDAEDNLPRRLR